MGGLGRSHCRRDCFVGDNGVIVLTWYYRYNTYQMNKENILPSQIQITVNGPDVPVGRPWHWDLLAPACRQAGKQVWSLRFI